MRYNYDLRKTSDVTVIEDNPVYTFGGHWETEIAGALTFGATFVNQQQLNSEADRKDGYLRGGVPFPEIQPPEAIVLRLADDSPEDGAGGAALFRVVMDLEGTAAGVDTLLSSDPRSPHYRPELEPMVAGGRRVRDHREANGTDVITVTFLAAAGRDPAPRPLPHGGGQRLPHRGPRQQQRCHQAPWQQ